MNNLNWEKQKFVSYSLYQAYVGSLYLKAEDLENYGLNTLEKFAITIEKEGSRWYVATSEHEREDIDGNLDWQGKVIGFKTLKEAKIYAQEFAEYFLECQNESDAEQDEIDMQNAWDAQVEYYQNGLAQNQSEYYNAPEATQVQTVQTVQEVNLNEKYDYKIGYVSPKYGAFKLQSCAVECLLDESVKRYFCTGFEWLKPSDYGSVKVLGKNKKVDNIEYSSGYNLANATCFN